MKPLKVCLIGLLGWGGWWLLGSPRPNDRDVAPQSVTTQALPVRAAVSLPPTSDPTPTNMPAIGPPVTPSAGAQLPAPAALAELRRLPVAPPLTRRFVRQEPTGLPTPPVSGASQVGEAPLANPKTDLLPAPNAALNVAPSVAPPAASRPADPEPTVGPIAEDEDLLSEEPPVSAGNDLGTGPRQPPNNASAPTDASLRKGDAGDDEADDDQAAGDGAGDRSSTGKDAAGKEAKASSAEGAGEDPHARLFAENQYPSAKTCRACHERIYEEWAISSHAYAYVSPMFHKFEQTITDLTQGTIGYFCVRCHSPVGVTVCQDRHDPAWESIPAAKEGVTCIVCHRVKERYGRVNGERRIEPGDLFEPIYGAGHGAGLHEVLAKKSEYKVKTSEDDKGPGQPIHQRVIQFDQISSSSFCASCHQVAVFPGIKLEVVWEQYRASPACKKGVSCQDCHMGKVPGLACGYDVAPKAIVNEKPVSPNSKHSNHTFFGPGYSIAHPGIFPFHKDGDRWSMQDWLKFDYRAGWGTEKFEEQIEDEKIKVAFPKVWQEVDDRIDAREIIDENLKRLAVKKQLRREVMENGSHVDGPFFDRPPRLGDPLKFHYVVTNRNEGHNMPTASLGAQPQLWLNVVLTGPSGEKVWESGYTDANGDMADLHSLEVAARRIRHDDQLFNLQTKFLTTNVKGTEREMCLPINVDVDQLPFIRPGGVPVTVLNHPPLIRMEAHSLSALGSRPARYRIPSDCLKQPGRYRLSARMRSRAEPIYFMRFCRATPDMEQAMNEGILDFHEQAAEFLVR